MRRRIAVLVAQIDESLQSRFLKGFIEEAYAHDYDVCVFTMYQKFQETALRNSGDSNIYELVNYDLFDAVVVLSDTILTPGLALPLLKHIHEVYSGLVLVIDKENPYFDFVKMDHYSPVRKIVDHLIDVHGYKDIAFLGGKEGHQHSVQRLNAFLDSMNEHGLEVKDEWVFHGNYWYDSADDFADRLLEDLDNLPRAIVCANDYMAIGLAARLTESGISIPDQVAITGYDSVDEGKYSPLPLTSADIPGEDCGRYSLSWVHAKLNGEEISEFVSHSPICSGGSCGCKHDIEMVPKKLRSTWRTQQSSKSQFSDFNHMLEDLMAQKRINSFMNVIVDYAYQIKPFNSFSVCLNEGFTKPSTFIGENAIRKGYSENVYRVLYCVGDDNKIDTSVKFRSKELIPELFEYRDYPTTFIFNPLYSEDRCFGYTVLNYGKEVRVYNSNFRQWMRDIMQGIEAYYRQGFMLSLLEKLKSSQIRDALTGLYNYEGFVKISGERLLSNSEISTSISVITVDIKGMRQINEIYGRDIGEKAIKSVARFISGVTEDNEVSCRLCNDEFLISVEDDFDNTRSKAIISDLEELVSDFKFIENSDYRIGIRCSSLFAEINTLTEFEAFVNQAISIKNHKKANSSNKSTRNTSDLIDELKLNQIVMDILNKNLLTYYYQPIVNANDGSIYAYEALMRCETKGVTPLQILESASYLDRLSDVEKYTLLNVTSDVENRIEMFGDSKVFINSLPGIELNDVDESTFASRIMNSNGRYVIEFTEESELDDAQLINLKTKFENYGCRIAVDDYGAGYSNVNNLLRYMPNYVKIDRMLVSEIQKNPQKQHFVRSIIGFAHDNGILALAEGVETRDEMYECLSLGIDLIQGFYLGRPQRNPISSIDRNIITEIEEFKLQSVGWRTM